MKVRMIIECDHADVGKLLAVMPSNADWHATRAPRQVQTPSMRQAVIESVTQGKTMLPGLNLNKKGDRRGKSPKNAERRGRSRTFVLGLLNQGPANWGKIIAEGYRAHQYSKSLTSSIIKTLVVEGRVQKDEHKIYTITEVGKKDLAA